jgi:ubiquinone/menaquinone biosynthesis C-methylase UbiE
MLDIGTGPGHIPLLVCERIGDAELVGIDLATTMLEHANRHRLASPHAHRIEYRIADAKRLDFPDNAFDTVFSNTILHHIPDPEPFLAEARRALRPGGCLLIRDLFRPDTQAQVDQLVERHAAGASPYQAELFRASLHAALTMDNAQAKMLKFMPYMMLVFCYTFSSALSLYWTVSNVFTIGQQLIINRMKDDIVVAPPAPAKTSGGGKRKKKR